MKPILDPASGSRMFYFDKSDTRVLFGDIRQVDTTLCDGRKLVIDPDASLDFRALPFPDNTFNLVVFDPPHLIKAGKQSWLALKYGRLNNEWQDDIKQGFKECFRVLKSGCTLVFKWNETQIPLRDILALTPHKPVLGHISGKRSNTHWVLFLKD